MSYCGSRYFANRDNQKYHGHSMAMVPQNTAHTSHACVTPTDIRYSSSQESKHMLGRHATTRDRVTDIVSAHDLEAAAIAAWLPPLFFQAACMHAGTFLLHCSRASTQSCRLSMRPARQKLLRSNALACSSRRACEC